ncbi:MAG TPA: DinB family protein [Terriglobales bacterium]|nr:DinB family protein [Terriglobales bacterium]
MTNREFFIRCWQDEYPVFLKTMRAVPADRWDYRPHPNSRSAADLVWLQVVEKRCWFELLESGQIDWKLPPITMNLAEMIAAYEKAHLELAPRLREIDDTSWLQKPAKFVVDGHVYFETSMGHMFWLGLFDAIHHRGQLTVYIRPMDGKVPAIYGPSADDEVDLHQPFYGEVESLVSAR